MEDGHFKKILLALDGTDAAKEILPVVSQFAKRLNATVLLHNVVDPLKYTPLMDGLAAMVAADNHSLYSQRLLPSLLRLGEVAPLAILKEKAEKYLARIVLELARLGVQAEILVSDGDPANEIVRQARLTQCDLIAMSTHGRNFFTRAILGSVTSKVIRSATAPVLAITPELASDFLDKIWDGSESGHQSTLSRQQGEKEKSGKHIDKEIGTITTGAVLLDGSELAEDVLPYVLRLAQALTLEVVLLRAVANELPYLEPSAAMAEFGANFQAIDDALIEEAKGYLNEKAVELGKAGLKVRTQVLRGPPVPAIIDYIRANQINMVAMTTRGRTGLSRLILGSVSDGLIRSSGLPVLLVPSGQDRSLSE